MLKFLRDVLLVLLCSHRRAVFVRNVYGDEIRLWNWKRSIWRCETCGQLIGRPELVNGQ